MANSADSKQASGHQLPTADSHLMQLMESLQIESLSLEQIEKLHEFVAYHHQLKSVSTTKFTNSAAASIDPIAVKARKGMKRSKSSGSEYGFSPNRNVDSGKSFSDMKKGNPLRPHAYFQSEDVEVDTITSKQPGTPVSGIVASPSAVSMRTNSRGNGACQPLEKMNGVNGNILLCLSPHNGPTSSVNSPLMDQSSRSSSRCSSRNHNLLRPTAANRSLTISTEKVSEDFCQSVDIPSSSLRHAVSVKHKYSESLYYSEPPQTDLSFIEADDAIASAGSIDKLVQHNLYVARSLENGSSGSVSNGSCTSKQRHELVASPHSAFDDCCSIGSHSLNSNRSNLGSQSTIISSPSSTFQKRLPANQKNREHNRRHAPIKQ